MNWCVNNCHCKIKHSYQLILNLEANGHICKLWHHKINWMEQIVFFFAKIQLIHRFEVFQVSVCYYILWVLQNRGRKQTTSRQNNWVAWKKWNKKKCSLNDDTIDQTHSSSVILQFQSWIRKKKIKSKEKSQIELDCEERIFGYAYLPKSR